MARTVLTYGGLNLNDGVNYALQHGFDPGERLKTFDELGGYDGTVAQVNVTEANLIPMSVPLRVQSAATAVPLSMPAGSSWTIDYTAATYAPGHGILSLRFDDGDHTDFDYTVARLEERGLVAGFAVNSDLVGSGGGYLSVAHLQKIESLGNEVMCHSASHGTDPATFGEFYDETVGSLAALTALGFNVVSFVQPGSWTHAYNIDLGAGWVVGCPADLLLRANFAAYEGYLGTNWVPLPNTVESRYGFGHASPTDSGVGFIDNLLSGGPYDDRRLEMLFHSSNIWGGGLPSAADFITLLDYIADRVAAGALTLLTPTQAAYAVPA